MYLIIKSSKKPSEKSRKSINHIHFSSLQTSFFYIYNMSKILKQYICGIRQFKSSERYFYITFGSTISVVNIHSLYLYSTLPPFIFTHILKFEEYLKVFLTDDKVPIDYSSSKRTLKNFTINCKN